MPRIGGVARDLGFKEKCGLVRATNPCKHRISLEKCPGGIKPGDAEDAIIKKCCGSLMVRKRMAQKEPLAAGAWTI